MPGLKVRKVATTTAFSTITPLIAESLSFAVKTVVVDNYSGRWLRIDPDGKFVPPYTIGVVIDMFVQSQQITVFTGVPTGVFVPTGSDGLVIIGMYEDAQYPFPGMSINPPQVQMPAQGNPRNFDISSSTIPGNFEVVGIGVMAPEFYADGTSGESDQHVQARQAIWIQTDEVVCAANVVTNFAGIVNLGSQDRLMFIQVGTNTSGRVKIDHSSGTPLGLYRNFLMPGGAPGYTAYGNGFNLNGSNLSRFTAEHDVGGTVYLTVGLGLS